MTKRIRSLRSILVLTLAISPLVACGPSEEPSRDLEQVRAESVQHVTVAAERGRFKAWPANGGIWSWGNEIVVRFTDCVLNPSIAQSDHARDPTQPCYTEQVRSLDGGITWTIEGKEVVTLTTTPANLEEPMDFSHPDFALLFKSNSRGEWEGRPILYYSYDRGRSWNGPYMLPMFDREAVFPRTDYIINGKRDLMAFISGGPLFDDDNGHSPFLIRTRDGGLTWIYVAPTNRPAIRLTPPALDYTVQPSSVRLSPTKLLSLARCEKWDGQGPDVAWIEAWTSNDDGLTWSGSSRIETGGAPTPPSLTLLPDGGLVVTYGYRAEPFGIRARISDDQGATWSDEFVLRSDAGNWDIGYTRDALRPDGNLVSVYYFNRDIRGDRTIEATIWNPRLAFRPRGSSAETPQ